MRCKITWFIGLFFFVSLSVFGDVKTGCLVQGDSKLYTNFIGNRDPYTPGNQNPSIQAYNGTPTAVDNRSLVDVICGTYFISAKTETDCFQYSNMSTPVFVGNGRIATITQKCVELPIDDYSPYMLSGLAALGVFMLRKSSLVNA